jgi:hypothetical protein
MLVPLAARGAAHGMKRPASEIGASRFEAAEK